MPNKNKRTPKQEATRIHKFLEGYNLDEYNEFKRELNRLIRQSTKVGSNEKVS